jgi:DNA-binding transcriptional LysR family regulator
MDRIVGLEVFVKVVESGSFASAARHFGVSPAMVSKHIQALEDLLRARLLYRTTRRVSPTEVGQGYYQRCVRILAELADADQFAGDLQTEPRGTLKVSVPVSFGNELVAASTAGYLTRYPEVSVEVTHSDRHVDLIERGFDLAIRAGVLPDSSLIARRLTTTAMVLCAAPGYVARHGAPETPADLAGRNCLDSHSRNTDCEWVFAGPDGRRNAVSIHGRFRTNNTDALRRLVLQGEGIALEPSFMVERDVKAGRLVPLLNAYRAADMPIHAVYPHSRFLSAKVRSFVEFLASEFALRPEWSVPPGSVRSETDDAMQRLRVAA